MTKLAANHDVEDAIFLIDDPRERVGALRREGLAYRIELCGY